MSSEIRIIDFERTMPKMKLIIRLTFFSRDLILGKNVRK